MTAKEYLFENHPEVIEEWGLTNHDDEYMCRMMEEYANEKLSAIWNFFPGDGLPKEDKPVLIFRPNHIPEVIGAFYEGDIEYGEFHNGEDGVHRVVYTNIKAWCDVLQAPKEKLKESDFVDTDKTNDSEWYEYPC